VPDLDLIKQGEQGRGKKRPLVAERPFFPSLPPSPRERGEGERRVSCASGRLAACGQRPAR
jgi:hypothetical protein